MEQLGINWGLLVAQIFNVAFVIWLLSRLLYQPVLKMLNERTERIQQSLQEADRVKEQMAGANREYETELARARQEAAAIVAQAQERAKTQEAEIVAQARQEAERIRRDAREQLDREREQMLRDLKGQVADLVTITASKVLAAELKGRHDALIEESLAGLGRNN